MEWTAAEIQKYDVVVIATAHEAVNYEELGAWSNAIVHTRDAMATVEKARRKVWKA